MKLGYCLPPCFDHFTLAIEFLLEVFDLVSQCLLPRLLEVVLILSLLLLHLLNHIYFIQRLCSVNFIFHTFSIAYDFVKDALLRWDIKFRFTQPLAGSVHSPLASW